MTDNTVNKMFELMVKKFDLHKKQSTTDVFIKKGEINSINKLITLFEMQIKAKFLEAQRKLKSYKSDEVSMAKFSMDIHGPKYPDLFNTYLYLKVSKTKEINVYSELTAKEKLFEILDKNLEESLRELDLLEIMSNKKIAQDVQIRLNTGKCAMKRPGRVKFPCDEELVEGEKYCKEHLKQFHPERYFEIFDVEKD